MRLIEKEFNPVSNLFPTLLNSFFADDNLVKHSLKRQKAVENWLKYDKVAANIKNLEEHFIIELAVPGYDKTDFKVEIEREQLVISASHQEVQNEDKHFTHKEFALNGFERRFNLPKAGIDTNAIKATYQAGILTVRIPKKEVEEHKRKIDIE